MKQEQYFTLENDIYSFKEFEQMGIKINFSTRHNGYSTGAYSSNNLALHVGDEASNVLKNREQYAKKIGTTLTNSVYTMQTHSANVHLVDHDNRANGATTIDSAIADCDGLYTFSNDLTLNAFVADCTPVYFINPTVNLVGVIHAGWQGTVKSIVYQALSSICQKHQLNPSDFHVVIGPSIEMDHFEVGQDVIDLINDLDYIDYQSTYEQISATKYHANVKKINYLQAIAAGVKAENIYVTNLDTFSNDDFFSYRQNNQTGRMCASIYQTNN